MAGETAKTRAVCLEVFPWSATSHVVRWLSPEGTLATSVKGAVRPKSAFLGQYDLNYTCEIVYYLRSRGGLHALRECSPLERRDALRGDWRALALAGHFRSVARDLAPSGPEAAAWTRLLEGALDRLASPHRAPLLAELVSFEVSALKLAGLSPDVEAQNGAYLLRGERKMPVPEAVARCIRRPLAEKNREILLDAARVIGVFYAFHLEKAPEGRRAAVKMVST